MKDRWDSAQPNTILLEESHKSKPFCNIVNRFRDIYLFLTGWQLGDLPLPTSAGGQRNPGEIKVQNEWRETRQVLHHRFFRYGNRPGGIRFVQSETTHQVVLPLSLLSPSNKVKHCCIHIHAATQIHFRMWTPPSSSMPFEWWILQCSAMVSGTPGLPRMLELLEATSGWNNHAPIMKLT